VTAGAPEAFDPAALSGVLTIDLAALRANYRALAERVAPAGCGAVVKANAYGLGVLKAAPALFAEGCRHFFVAHLLEAAELRPHLPAEATLYVLNGVLPGGEDFAAAQGFVPVLNSREQIRRWSETAARRGERLPAILQFDTGMSRLGLSPEEAAELLEAPAKLAPLDIRFVMSHLASADEPESAQNSDQLAGMQAIAAHFGQAISFANSGGVMLGPAYHGALARPGIALYGGNPQPGAPNPMRPVVSLAVRVIQTRSVPAGARVGYGATHVAKGPARLATLAAGYADGLPRSLSPRGSAFFGGARMPIVGRVSMDSMTVDASALAPDALRLGTLVELIGANQTVDALAADAGTISYEILTSLGKRYQRVYV